MSHFKIAVEVPKGKLEQFMRATVGPWSIQIEEYHEDATVATNGKAKKTRGRAVDADLMTMSGTKPFKKSMLAKALVLFEKLEAEQGIGTVTRKDARKYFVEKGLHVVTLNRMVKAGHLRYL